MKADSINFREFINAGRRTFTIPVYQRNYEWKAPECIKLFNDIEAIANGGSHFIGTVVYVTSDTNATWSEFTIIDGQQRLTTVMLLLKAIHELTEDEATKAEIWEDYLTNRHARDNNYRLKLKPIETDLTTWNSIVDGSAPASTSSNLWKNYELFKDLLIKSASSPEDIFEAIGRIEIVYIQLTTGRENPQIIFESINSTGVSLTQGDLIRNYLLMNCESLEVQTRYYNTYWVKIERYLTAAVIPDFVRDFLTIKTGTLVNKNAVYEKFKFYHKNDFQGTEEDLLQELCRFAEYYYWFKNCASDETQINTLLRQFHEIKSTVAFSVMLWLFDKCYCDEVMTKSQLCETLQILLCYQYRRTICRYSSNALNKIYMVLPREIGESETDIPKKLLKVLAKKVRTQTFPRNEEFRNAFKTFDMYSTKLAKYTLSMLENKINPRENVSLTAQITIEHIMPQTLTPTWKAALGRNSEQILSQWQHTIGNLTLSGSNSELGNKTFGEKKAILSQSNFAISREISDFSSWQEDSIKERADRLTEIALELWSIPDELNDSTARAEVDYTTTYNIMDDIDVTGEKPLSYIFDDDEKNIDTWKALFLGVLRDLYEFDTVTFDKLINHETFTARHLLEPIGSDYIFRDKSNDEICPGYFAELNHSAQDLLTFAQIAAETYDLQDDIFFTLRPRLQRQNNDTTSNQRMQRQQNNTSRINISDTERAFRAWMVSNGRVESTAVSYSSLLRGSLVGRYENLFISNANLFEYGSLEDFNEAFEQIQNHPDYAEINERLHNSHSAALKAYYEFLLSLNPTEISLFDT